LVVGQAMGLIQAIHEQAAQRAEGKHVNSSLRGTHRSPLTMAAADHGLPELALGMNVDALIVGPIPRGRVSSAGCEVWHPHDPW
jgi:hypothetical protein